MTKKDYIALSKVFTGLQRDPGEPFGLALTIAARMAKVFRENNPSFDSDRFIAACKKEYER